MPSKARHSRKYPIFHGALLVDEFLEREREREREEIITGDLPAYEPTRIVGFRP